MKVEREIEIAAAPEAVYDLVADVDRLDEWVTIHERLEQAPDGPLEKGATLEQCLKLAGRRFKVRWKVVESDRPRRLVWDGRGPVRSKAKVVNTVAASDDGSQFTYVNEFELPGGPLGRMAGPMVKRVTAKELEESLRRLKALLE